MSKPQYTGKYGINYHKPVTGPVHGDNNRIIQMFVNIYHVLIPPGEERTVGKALFLAALNTFIVTLFADWVKLILSQSPQVVLGSHPGVGFWQIVVFSFPEPFLIGLLVGVITFFYYRFFGLNFLDHFNKR